MALFVLLLSVSLWCAVRSAHGDHLTDTFTAVELTEAQFKVQKPYNVPLDQRYEFTGGVRRMWVYSSDKPISSDHPGGPRTEIKIQEIYSSGVWQFEGYGCVPAGTSGVSVMQIFGAVPGHATTLMLHVYDGQLTYYHNLSAVVDGDIYDRWFRLNVVHDVGASKVTVFVDGTERLTAPGHGGLSHYFKFGVYGQSKHNMSSRMESRWRDVRVFRKDAPPAPTPIPAPPAPATGLAYRSSLCNCVTSLLWLGLLLCIHGFGVD